MKKLYRSENDKVLAGIIGGLGEYFDIDPILLRLGFVVLVFVTGIFPGIIAYIIALFIVPQAPHNLSTIITPSPMEKPKTDEPKPFTQAQPEVKTEPKQEPIVTPPPPPISPAPAPEAPKPAPMSEPFEAPIEKEDNEI